jgi:hypothetical protein
MDKLADVLTVTKIWSWAPDGYLTPRLAGLLTVGSTIILTLILEAAKVSNISSYQSKTRLCSLIHVTTRSGLESVTISPKVTASTLK